MRVLLLALSVLFVLAGSSCKNGRSRGMVIRDTSITSQTAFNDLFLDSSTLGAFLHQHPQFQEFREQFENFYTERNYAYAWFDSSGLSEQANNFYNLQSAYITDYTDSSLYDAGFNQLYQSVKAPGKNLSIPDSTILRAELSLTGQFFRYAAKVYAGTDMDAAELGWFIPRKKIDLQALLDSTIRTGQEQTAFISPQYRKLEAFLSTYAQLEKQIGSDTIASVAKPLRKGDSAAVIPAIRKRLFLLGDLKEDNNIPLLDTTLVLAVKQFQQRMGLLVDGVIGNRMINELNVPVRQRIQQILVNLERLRWMPPDQGQRYILVNIPSYNLQLVDSGKQQFRMNVIVGSAANNTVIFTGKLQYIVFSPYWNVPESIVRNEILPAMKKDPNYLAKQNMEIVTDGTIPVIRQKSGPRNSLGHVKFLFPNSYNIYLHDTPNRNLFAQSTRNLSHGCIRLGEPKKLASYLLQYDSSWTSRAIDSAMYAGKEKWVTLKHTIPVYIVYFTSWVDADGLINFRRDIYKHDEKLAAKLFRKS